MRIYFKLIFFFFWVINHFWLWTCECFHCVLLCVSVRACVQSARMCVCVHEWTCVKFSNIPASCNRIQAAFPTHLGQVSRRNRLQLALVQAECDGREITYISCDNWSSCCFNRVTCKWNNRLRFLRWLEMTSSSYWNWSELEWAGK